MITVVFKDYVFNKPMMRLATVMRITTFTTGFNAKAALLRTVSLMQMAIGDS